MLKKFIITASVLVGVTMMTSLVAMQDLSEGTNRKNQGRMGRTAHLMLLSSLL